MSRKILLVPLMILALAFTWLWVAAQDDASVTVRRVDDASFPTLRLLVNVDEATAPGRTLGAEAFGITVNGETVPVQSLRTVRAEDVPISVVLVLDSSESMAGKPLDDTKAAALQFLERLSPGDEVALVRFGSTVETIQPYTTDVEAVRTAVQGLQPFGRTALYDAVTQAVTTAQQANNEQRFVVFLTDGNEFGNLSSNTNQGSLEQAANSDVSIFTVGLGFGVDELYLSDVARVSNGEYYVAPVSGDLGDVFDLLVDFLRTEYVLTVETDLEPNGETAAIAVAANDETGTLDYQTVDLFPQITVNAPQVPVTALTDITVDVAAPRNVATVAVALGGAAVEVGADLAGQTEGSFAVTVDPSVMVGDIPLTVTVTDAAGGSRTTTATLNVVAPPSLALTGLDSDVVSTSPLDLTLDLQNTDAAVTSVTYRVDGEVVATDTTLNPFTLNTFAYALGEHTLAVTVVFGGESLTTEQVFNVLPVTSNDVWTPVVETFNEVDMVLVPAGCFEMGGGTLPDEQPATRVCVSEAFWMDVTPITNDQYGSTGLFVGADVPRDRITWNQATDYCASRGGRLPTEAEWEYAARGPDALLYPWGDIYEPNFVVSVDNADGQTQPVGEHPGGMSWVGAMDMSGNVWEWTSSAYLPYPYDAEDGREALDADLLRVLRGGAATNRETDLRAVNRYARLPDTSLGLTGMRCVMDYSN